MKFHVNQGQNIIKLLVDDFSNCLVIEKALIVNWPDCRGSVGEYYSISNYSNEERTRLTNELNNVLSEGNEDKILESLQTFINLFSNGEYDIHFYTLKIKEHCFLKQNLVKYHESVPENERFSGSFFPCIGEEEYIFDTIPDHQLNPERVNYYIDQIKKGNRPKVMLLEAFNPYICEYTSTYILDGHHKLEAYLKLEIDIPAVKILKQCDYPNDTEEILKYIQPILKDFEFNHYFKNNENITQVNFYFNTYLTEALDAILQNDITPGLAIVKLLINAGVSENENENQWLKQRLNVLAKNRHLGRGLFLYSKKFDETSKQKFWFQFEINTQHDLKMWLKKVLKIKPNIFDLFLANYWY